MTAAVLPLALTMGDPAGIGGELTCKAWRALSASGPVFFAIDDPARLRAIDPALPLRVIAHPSEAASVFASALPVLPLALAQPARPARPDPANARATIAAIERAAALALAGDAGGIVTNPITKSALYDAGFAHPGHTEFLAELTGGQRPVMMLASPLLRVVPVTIHLALRDAIAGLTAPAIVETARITEAALRRDFGIARPRLAVAGLNPHAGEGGALGDEEMRLIGPAIAALAASGLDVSGPWPPDAMFTPEARARYDVAIGMYHDQVLIPLKTLDMRHGVNVTLGLPVVRTSPDHGTAYDIAGRGIADPDSLIAALRLAAELAAARARAQPCRR
jgi:4-hydroxythreonine-4-phosphate dehydrogenase